MDRVIVDKMQVTKLRRGDVMANESKHFKASGEARKKIEQLKDEKEFRDYYEY